MTVAERILEAVDDDICERLCGDCPWKEYTAATMNFPSEVDCPSGLIPSDPGCKRREWYLDLEDAARRFEEVLNNGC